MTTRPVEHPNYTNASTLESVAFWSPLPDVSALSPAARDLVRESDADIRGERLNSALDASLGVNAIEPQYIPGFVRTAELLFATRRKEHARRLLRTISSRQSVCDPNEFSLELSKIRAHVEPGVDLIVSLARRVLETGETPLVTPYVPAAIDQLYTADRAAEGTEIARLWVESSPDNPLALAYLVLSHLRERNGQAALQTIRRFRDEFNADQLWPENIVVSALTSIASDSLEPKWMAAGFVCQELRTGALDYKHVTDLLEFLVPVVDSPQRALLFAGLLALNANDLDEARGLYQTTSAETPVESYVRHVGLERIAQVDGDNRSRFTALKECWRALGDSQVSSFAESGALFDPPATRATIGVAIAQVLRESEAYTDALKFLKELLRTGHDDPEIVRLHAEIMGQSGSRDEALEQLEKLLRQQESKHNYASAIETLETMIRLIPGSIRLRARLVENCLKVGNFTQAIEQLVMQARLLNKAGKLSEAEPPIHRAIEISTMINDWKSVNRLHRLLISFDPDETRLRHAAVTTYVQYGRTDDALNQLREIVRIARKRNNLDEAIAASHQMLALDPNEPGAYHQLGELLISIQEYGQADRVYRRLATIVPDDPAVKAKRSAIAALTRSRSSMR